MKRKFQSKITGKEYTLKETVRILNPQQAADYMYAGAELLDLYVSKHYETGNPVIVFLFARDEKTHEVYDKWCNHCLY